MILGAYSQGLAFPGQQKPRGKPKINWSHPLTEGLLFYGFDTGASVIDLVGGSNLTTVGTSDTSGAASGGPGVSYSGSSIYLPTSAAVQAAQTGAAGISWACAYVQTGTVGAFTRPFCRTANNGGSQPFTNWDFEINPSSAGQNTVCMSFAGPTGIQTSSNWTGNANNVFTTLVGTVADLLVGFTSTVKLYALGSLVVSGTAPDTRTSVTTNDATIFSGSSDGAVANNFVGNVYYGAFWNRVLSADEVTLLTNDPYCFLIPAEGEMPALYNPVVLVSGIGGGHNRQPNFLPKMLGRLPQGVQRGLTMRMPCDDGSCDNFVRDIVGNNEGYYSTNVAPNYDGLGSSRGLKLGTGSTGSGLQQAIAWATPPIDDTNWTGTCSFWLWLDTWNTDAGDGDPRYVAIGTTTDFCISSENTSGTLAIRYGGLTEHFGTVLPLSQWTHICATYATSGNALRVYVNGVDVTSLSGFGDGTTAGHYSFGGRSAVLGGANDRQPVGRMLDVRFYNGTALTPGEVNELYQSAFVPDEVMMALFNPTTPPGVAVAGGGATFMMMGVG